MGFGLRLVALDGQRVMTVTELGQVVIAGPTMPIRLTQVRFS